MSGSVTDEMETPKESRVCRWLVQWWLRLRHGKIRLLPAAYWDEEGPILFVVGQPLSLTEALALATAFPRPIHFLLPDDRGGFIARLLARGVGMIAGKLSSESVPEEAAEVLSRRGMLTVFPDGSLSSEDTLKALAAAATALIEAVETELPGKRVTVHPVHLYMSPASRVILIYADAALPRNARPSASGRTESDSPALAANLEEKLRRNAFQLRPDDVEYFLKDIEEILRTSLREEWASRTNWKQDAEDFVLSRHVVEWVNEANNRQPARLVALRESLDRYRNHLQQFALRQGEVEAAGPWASSRLRRTIVWGEFILGLPIALFGFLNHLAIGALLFAAGSFRKNLARARSTEWTIRAVVVLACYTVETLLVARWWGRAVAGYYAPALPVSGVYLARFWWLIRHRARPLFLSIRRPAMGRKARRQRQVLLDELDQAFSASEEQKL